MSEESLFLAALEKSTPAERQAFLEQACGQDVDLLSRVKALLEADGRFRGILDHTMPPPEATVAYDPALNAGALIAERYALAEKIGEGGMGEVWVARQTEPVKRRVALKVIKAGMDSKAVLQRFEQERQALAMMDHPNIAKVLDGGLTEQRRPFFVMELVNGLPLTRFCDESKLGIRERLELFAPICQAVQHAHQKGIIHRDLKPSNILVTIIDGRGVPKVIDFGVAKATSGRLTEESLSTQFGVVVGTFEYMAPEQAGFAGEDIDTRADIYSLGVILYELLTGLKPLDGKRLKQAVLTEMIRIIKEEEPSKPSTRLSADGSAPSLAAVRRTEPNKLAAMLRGELDWVVMKCLEKRRDRRYETANALARDIQRYLADEPIEARPTTTAYRMGKFLRRHRGPVLAAAALAGLLIAGVIGTSVGMVRAWDAEQQAVNDRNDAEQAQAAALKSAEHAVKQTALARAGFDEARRAVDRSFTLLSESRLLNVAGLQPLRKSLLEEALTYYRTFAERWSAEPSLRHELADATSRVAAITAEIGDKRQALIDYREAARLYRSVRAGAAQDLELGRKLATCDNNSGKILMELDRHTEALAAYERSEAATRRLAEKNPGRLELEQDMARARGNLAMALDQLGRRDEALKHLDAAVTFHRRELAARKDPAQQQHVLAGLLNTRGTIRTRQTRYAEAAAAFREAVALERAGLKENPLDNEYRAWLGNHCFNLALLCESYLHRPEEALVARREAAEVYEKLATDNPAVSEYRYHAAQACLDLGNLLLNLKKDDPAPLFAKARVHVEPLTREQPDVARYQSSLGAALSETAGILFRAGRSDQARELLEQAVRISNRP